MLMASSQKCTTTVPVHLVCSKYHELVNKDDVHVDIHCYVAFAMTVQ